MGAQDILAKLKTDEAALSRFGVRRVGVFGSVARGEDNLESDVDILVDFFEGRTPGLFGFVRLQNHLETVLSRKVDLATPDSLHHALREEILAEAVFA